MKRKELALKILNKYKSQEYHYLGEGFSGIVFHDNQFVYKVHIPKAHNNYGEMDGLLFLIQKINSFRGSKFFYELEVIKVENTYILKYRYEPSSPIKQIYENEFIEFLADCWKRKIICKSITKEKNFIRVNDQLKFVDYEILPYNDNLFLNSVARAYIYLKYPHLKEEEYNRLKRSIVNNFSHKSLEGFGDFLNKIFLEIMFSRLNAKSTYVLDNKFVTLLELKKYEEKEFWNEIRKNKYIWKTWTEVVNNNNEFHINVKYEGIKLKMPNKKVSLLIKTCAQDSKTAYQQIRHIIKQLSAPDIFLEKVVLIDKKEKNFLRQYTTEGNLDELRNIVARLIEEQVIDQYIELPDELIEEVNLRWFKIKTKETHTIENIPLTSQVYAFEKLKGEYILQMDIDVLIGRKDFTHSFLNDMIEALEKNENAVSVGFNIPKKNNVKFIEYHAPPGGYKPEVRFSLIHKQRLLNLLPLPNELVNNKPKWGWYHALHNLQKMSNIVSLRGGDSRSYYIHPQNYRKPCKYLLYTVMDRIEKNIIPEIQKEKFDLEGSFYDWAIPKRNEELIVFAIIEKNTDINSVFRFYTSIKSQKFKNTGIILINNDPDILKDKILWDYFSPIKNVTYIHIKEELFNTELLYLAIHYFVENLESKIIIANPSDYFLGENVFEEIKNRMELYDSDLIIGKHVMPNSIKNMGLSQVDFINTREFSSNLFGYVKVFTKELFERVYIMYYKKSKKIEHKKQNNFEKMSKKYEWYNDYEFTNLFSILVEAARNPIRFDFYNYVIDQRTIDFEKIKKNYEIIKNHGDVKTHRFIGKRIDFQPNLNKIEIDITYHCNLKCLACNRSCSQAPSKDENMSVEQIKQFIKESKELGIKWKLINILGGEPTLHPQFLEIIELILNNYIIPFSPETVLQITSNGYSQKTRDILEKIPKHPNIIMDKHSFKNENKITYFTPFNNAPVDNNPSYEHYSTGCWVTSYCGIGLNKYGYYPCGVAGSIDRVIGLDVGIKSLKEVNISKLKKLLSKFCKYCGNFIDSDINYGNFIPRCERKPFKNIVSKSWKRIYQEYNIKKPKLTPIYD